MSAMRNSEDGLLPRSQAERDPLAGALPAERVAIASAPDGVDEPSRPMARGAAPGEFTGLAQALSIGSVNRASSGLLVGIGVVFVALLVWAALARVDDVTRADGRVVPSARLQVVQNLEGGIIRALHVKQGERVEAGAELVSLSPTQFGSEYDSQRQQLMALAARMARLSAESSDAATVAFPPELLRDGAAFVAAERAEWSTRRARLAADQSVLDAQVDQRSREADDTRQQIVTLQRSLQVAREEHAIVALMVERGLEPRVELLRADARLIDLEGRLATARLTLPRQVAAVQEAQARREALLRQYRSETSAELTRVNGELRTLQTAIPALADRVERTGIRAPVKGIVNRLFVSTVGGVVKPGDPIAEIVPADDELVVEARIRPQDIGFVKVGHPARVKLSAYDYSIFGTMEGTVTQIGADAVPAEDGKSSFYLARVATRTKVFEASDRRLAIIPGMEAQIDIVTGNKTVLTYLSKPLVAVRENAFRER